LDKPACQAAEIEYDPSGWSVPYFLLNWGKASAWAQRGSLILRDVELLTEVVGE
jgi:hypothetical protein